MDSKLKYITKLLFQVMCLFNLKQTSFAMYAGIQLIRTEVAC